MSHFFIKGFVFKTRCFCLNVKFNQQLNNKLNKPSGDYTASRVPKVLLLCYGVDLNEWDLLTKQMIRFPPTFSSFVHHPLSNSHRGIRSGCPEHWDTMENSLFWPLVKIPNPLLPAEGIWGAPGDAQLEETQPQRLKGSSGRASQPPAAGEGQRCHSAAPERELKTIREQARISPGSECFIFLLPLMNLIWRFMLINPDLKQLYLESRFHCRGIPAAWQMQLFWASIASSASSSSIPFLFQTLNVH